MPGTPEGLQRQPGAFLVGVRARPHSSHAMRGEFVDLDGAHLYYYAAGTRGAGEPVVLIHGFPTSGHLWAEVVPLMPPGHRVVVVDLLGYGRSDRPRTRAVTIQAHADRTIQLFDALGIKEACVVGHDIGGGVAQSMAVRYPDRVSRICLIDSVAFDGWSGRKVRLARAVLPVARHLPPTWLLPMLRDGLLRGYADHDRGVHSVAHYVRPFGGTEGRDVLVRHIRELDVTDTAGLAPHLKDVEQPVAIVWGENDPFLPATMGRRLRATIPNATLDIIPDARHFIPEEAPRRVADALTALLRR
jgi:pimeloyl-ACP methyl ester carboxylesterase